jgi:hypothetical protein
MPRIDQSRGDDLGGYSFSGERPRNWLKESSACFSKDGWEGQMVVEFLIVYAAILFADATIAFVRLTWQKVATSRSCMHCSDRGSDSDIGR